MKLLCGLLIIFVAFSCEQLETDYNADQPTEVEVVLEKLQPEHFDIIEIEGCEYLTFQHVQGTHGFGYMTHKGNCRNPIHCNNK